MKYGFLGLGFILAGMFGLVLIVTFESVTINNESEYYTLKEAMEASMLESVDMACARNMNPDGCLDNIKISEQKFVENFTRRFVNSVVGDATEYKIEFYDIIESPPKATIIISSKTKNFKLSTDTTSSFSIVNNLSGILELNHGIGGNYKYSSNSDSSNDNSIVDSDTSRNEVGNNSNNSSNNNGTTNNNSGNDDNKKTIDVIKGNSLDSLGTESD